MIERIWVRNFRMLASNRVDLRRFAVLVGRNASGKSTLMSALRFVSQVLSDGVARAVELALDGSGATFGDLCFREAHPLEFAVVVALAKGRYRYELEVGPRSPEEGPVVLRESLYKLPDEPAHAAAGAVLEQRSLFGDEADLDDVIHTQAPRRWRKIVGKTADGKDYFQDERTTWNNQFRFGPTRSALGSIPEDLDRFPGAIAVRNLLREGVRLIELDSHRLRLPSPPRASTRLQRDGSNLAASARALQELDTVAYEQWVSHVAGAVEGLEAVETWERPEDKHVVLRARFAGTHRDPVPSWLLSDGTLRLMALCLLAYAEREAESGLYLIEEPENGLHPLAIQAVFDALSQLRTTQVFIATHSPVFLASTSMEQALVFRRSPQGTSEIRRGDEIEAMRAWQQNVRLSEVFSTGVL